MGQGLGASCRFQASAVRRKLRLIEAGQISLDGSLWNAFDMEALGGRSFHLDVILLLVL